MPFVCYLGVTAESNRAKDTTELPRSKQEADKRLIQDALTRPHKQITPGVSGVRFEDKGSGMEGLFNQKGDRRRK